jgi:hypothetical protein
VTEIRPLERADLDQVARLHADAEGTTDEVRVQRLAAFFERTLFDYPWVDEEIPSLVYEEGGRVLGFLGSNVRRMRFDARPIRMTCSAHLIADPSVRHKAVGARLLRTYLDAPQELTITDGANEVVRRMWEKLGGRTVHLGCLSFVRILRPLSLATHRALSPRAAAAERAVAPVMRAADAAAGRLFHRPSGFGDDAEKLTTQLLLDHLPDVADGLRLVPRYDLEYLNWLYGELARVGDEQVFANRVARGPLVAETVRAEGRIVGWYVSHLRRGGLCRVVQLAAAPSSTGVVLDRLADRAHALGASGIYGRLEPHLVAPLSERRNVLRFSEGRLLVHSRDEELVDVILRGDAFLTRMDGEWW